MITEAYVVDGVTVVQDSVQGTGLNQFDYRGGWAHSMNETSSDDTNSYSSMTDDTALVRFVGTQITFFAVTDANHGVAAVSVDGGPETFVDMYSPSRTLEVPLWQSPQLPHGEHVFQLRVAGTMNQASRYIWAAIDKVEII